MKIPENIDINSGGQFENLARAGKRLMIVLPITIGIIFL